MSGSHEAEDRYRGMAEPSVWTPLGRVTSSFLTKLTSGQWSN